MNKQIKNSTKPLKYDKVSYQRHLAEIEALERELAELELQYAAADKRISDGMFVTSEVRFLSNQINRVRSEIETLKNKQIEIIDTSEESTSAAIGHVYHSLVKFPNGEKRDLVFKLVEENPFIGTTGQITEISVKSPIGACIYDQKIGGTYNFTVGGLSGEITVIEEVRLQSTEQDEM